MQYQILKKLKPNYVNNKNIFAFDIETKQKEIETETLKYIRQDFLMGSIVGKDFQKVFWNKLEMANYMVTNAKLRNALIYATNLEFDFIHVFQNTPQLKHMNIIDRNGIIYARHKDKQDKNSYHFLDTWNYTGKMSVEVMGKMLNITKLPPPSCFLREPKTLLEKIEMETYNIQDSLITYKFAEFIKDFCNSLGCKQKITIASIGLDNWRRNYQPIDLFQERKEWIKKHYQGAFHGGRTEVFKRGMFQDIWYYDFNSHYPACCHDGIDGKGSYPNPNFAMYEHKIPKCILEEFEGITYAKLKAPDMYIPVLGVSTDEGKYVFPKGIIENWFTNIEIREALKLGYEIIELKQGLYYTELFKPFRSAVKSLYRLRMKYDRQKNIPMKNMIKTVMNAGLFGKFAQKIDDKTIIYHKDSVYTANNGQLYVLNENGKRIELHDYLERGELIFEKVKFLKIPIFVNPILSSYTTALARIKLHNKINKIPENTIYCDTDSIITKKKMFSNSNELGELKLEYPKITEAIIIKPKFYYISTGAKLIFKSKGTGKIKNLQSFSDLLCKGEVSMRRFTKLKESAVRKLPFSSIIDINKKLNFEDNKRQWEKRFSWQKEQDSEALTFK